MNFKVDQYPLRDRGKWKAVSKISGTAALFGRHPELLTLTVKGQPIAGKDEIVSAMTSPGHRELGVRAGVNGGTVEGKAEFFGYQRQQPIAHQNQCMTA